MTVEGLKFQAVGDYELAYREAGSGTPILLIHGLAGDHAGWAAQIGPWSRQFRVIAPDTRGAGRSTQRDEHLELADLADDFLAFMTALGIERFHVVGRSMGGSTAQIMALKAPERVLSLALLASCAKFDPIGLHQLRVMREALETSGSWAFHANHSIANFVSHEFFNANPDRIAAILALIGGETRMQACYIQQNLAVGRHDVLDRLPEITCPVLCLGGGRDPLCGPLAQQWMTERFPDCEAELFERSSHFFLMEEPERFMARMDAWFARVRT